jgi:nitric oxide reductase NorD protein
MAEDGGDAVEAEISAGAAEAGESPLYAYDEWDHERRDYRKRWCTLREIDVEPGDPAFCEEVRVRYARHIAQLRRVFECVREAPRTLRRQPDGDSIDFDALIEGVVDVRCGAEMPALLFTQRHHVERDLAALFLIDMSGSTRGWVNDAEREALVMLCEALDVLGDRCAIYGFSGLTRERCEIFRVKRFGEPFGAAVCARIAGMKPQDYTRMGAAIRHGTMRLSAIEARTRLLVTLSDGKPDDYSDNYRGAYGIEDTRRALLEAHRAGVKPYCVTLDREARDYLPHLYGPASWSLVDDVTRLPFRLAEIYRRLTT